MAEYIKQTDQRRAKCSNDNYRMGLGSAWKRVTGGYHAGSEYKVLDDAIRDEIDKLVNWMIHPKVEARMELSQFWSHPAVKYFIPGGRKSVPGIPCDERTERYV